MNAHEFVAKFGIEEAKRVLDKSPSNAQSYQNGYYFRTTPEFQFHNGFHPVWNLTDNDGAWFKKDGFDPVSISELKQVVASIDTIIIYGGIETAKTVSKMRNFRLQAPEEAKARLDKAIEDYELVESYKEKANG